MSNGKTWHSLKEFMVHISIGAIAFVFISVIAIALSEWVSYLQEANFNPIIIKGLAAFEYLLFALDLLLASIFLMRSMYKLGKELW